MSHWGPGHGPELRKVLVEMSRDERVMGAAACGADLVDEGPHDRLPPAHLHEPRGLGSGAAPDESAT